MTSTGTKFRWLYLIAVAAGMIYYLSFPIHMPPLLSVALKGTGVTLLAIWAALNARDRGGWLITGVMAFGALGDVLLERQVAGQTPGALAFLIGHLIAIWLYLSHRRAAPSPSQWALAAVLLVATPVIAWLLVSALPGDAGVAVYATGLGAMAASAWLSRFPRYRVGIGAVMFVASDLLIFAKIGPLADSRVPAHLIWPLYFAGQALIAWGAVTTLHEWKDDDDLHHRL